MRSKNKLLPSFLFSLQASNFFASFWPKVIVKTNIAKMLTAVIAEFICLASVEKLATIMANKIQPAMSSIVAVA